MAERLLRPWHALAAAVLAALALLAAPVVQAGEAAEYRLKAAFVYNFLNFAEWPAAGEGPLTLCILGTDPFGAEIDGLTGKPVGARRIEVERRGSGDALKGCHAVFIGGAERIPRALELLRGQPVLTIADSPDAVRQGVMLAMRVAGGRVVFDAHVGAARAAGLTLNARLLRLAAEVAS